MNIFVTDTNPVAAASHLGDPYQNKMLVETCQLLTSRMPLHVRELLPRTKEGRVWGSTHRNHPCSIWVWENFQNFAWTVVYGLGLTEFWLAERGKAHACRGILEGIMELVDRNPTWLPEMGPDNWDGIQSMFQRMLSDTTPPMNFAIAIPITAKCRGIEGFSEFTAVDKYRHYMALDKNQSWEKRSRLKEPEWHKTIKELYEEILSI